MPNKPLITLQSLKDLYRNLTLIPVSVRGGRCIPFIEAQRQVRQWITAIEDIQIIAANKKNRQRAKAKARKKMKKRKLKMKPSLL